MGLFSKKGGPVEIPISELTPNKPKCYDDYIWDQFSCLYKFLAEKTVKWEELELDYYKATLTDGSIVFYDATEHSFRQMSREEAEFGVEENWRREFARRLVWSMDSKGIDQIKLSELTGISQSSISNYTRGVRTPSAYSCSVIAQALNCSLDFLVLRS